MVVSRGKAMVLVCAGTPLNLTIAAAGSLQIMSARRLPKVSRNAMLVGEAGGENVGDF
jgi:hypothetical protein